MEEEKTTEKDYLERLCEKSEQKIEELMDQADCDDGLLKLSKWVDIRKDIKQIKEEDNMRYGEYGYGDDSYQYGARGVPGTGRYSYGAENYGRRGVPGSGRGRYRGEEPLEEMKYHYGNYHESNSYGAKEDSAYKMTEAFKDFGFAISKELEPQEKMMFKKAMQEIMQELDR